MPSFKQGVADINEADILAIVKKYVDNDAGLAQKFCDYIQYRAGLLIGRGVDKRGWRVFTFPHRTFQEFLAGQHLLTTDFEEHAPKIARLGAGWREAMLLACGYLIYEHANDAEVIKAVGAILDDDPQNDTDWRAVWLASEMLSIVKLDNITKSNRGERVLKRTKTLLVQLIENGHLPPVERAGAGRILSQLGDPRKGVGTITVNGLTLPEIVWCHIPAGEFTMGSDERDDERPVHTLYLPDFYMSRYLVTYAQYQAFENAPDFGDERWWHGFPDDQKRQKFDQAFQYANHPRESVTWYGAMAFCRWLTHHINQAKLPMIVWDMTTKKYIERPCQRLKINLPSEAEYEKVARGSQDSRRYPYGDDFDPLKANTGETDINMTSAVGLFLDGASPYGDLDMSGNVWKWTRSKYAKYEYDSNDGREDEDGQNRRSLRGGSWLNNLGWARVSYRYNVLPNYRNYFWGCCVVAYILV